MLFNSLAFLAFFAVVYPSYLLVSRWRAVQNGLLLVASYVFYGYWDWRFLGLLVLSTVIDFTVGRRLDRTDDPRRRKLLVTVSVAANLSILGFFKYFGFFVSSFAEMFRAFGMNVDAPTLHIVLPVGISFYTFQTMSYTIDVYRRRLEPTHRLLDFAVFVAFFPQLVAGPIERASALLPQIARRRHVTWAAVNDGVFLILWGYFKKVVIADNMALIANPIFDHYPEYRGLDLLVGVLAFTFQIYGDFSGYSDIARGLGKLMGIDLLVNFKLPYFAVSPSDFWLRWHVSLSSWLRDYLYIPLGGNRGGSAATYRNLAITMLLGGLWHGAAWHFVLWGAFHGAILVVYRVVEREPIHADPWACRLAPIRVPAQMLIMFALTLVGWIIFRARTLDQIGGMVAGLGFDAGAASADRLETLAFFLAPLLAMQVWQYAKGDLLVLAKRPWWVLGPAYGFMLTWIVIFGVRESMEFIYFQF